MANSPLLQIPQVAPNQTNKETTINDGFSIMERSLNDVKQIDLTDGDAELDIQDYTRAFLFEMSGHLSTRALEVPASTRLFSVFNDGTSNVTITAKDTGGLAAVIPSGAYCVLFNNALDIRIISNSQASGQVSAFLSLPDTPNSFEGHAGEALVVNAEEDGMTFGTISVSFLALTDAPSSYSGQANRVVRVNSAGSALTFSNYLDKFISMTDTPGSYISQAGRMLIVNSLENSVEFADIPEAVVQATRTFTLANSSFEDGDFTNWIVPTTSGSIWAVDYGYGPISPYAGAYLAYFATGQGDEPASIGYEVDLTAQAYPEELDDAAEIVVEIAIAATDSSFGGFSIDFYDESAEYVDTATSPSYAGSTEMTLRHFKTAIPPSSRSAIIYVNITANPESFEPDQMDFAIDGLMVQLKLTVDQIVNFTQLFDVPHDYAGNANKLLAVNSSADGIAFIEPPVEVNKFTDLPDVPSTYSALRHVRVNAAANALEFVNPTFLQNSDTPSSYSGQGNKVLRVNNGGTAIIFTAYQLSTLTDVDFTTAPTEGQTIIYDSDTNKFKPGNTVNFPAFTDKAGMFLKVGSSETSVEWSEIGNAAFPVLTGNSTKVLVVKEDESGVEWVTGGGGGEGGDSVMSIGDKTASYTLVNGDAISTYIRMNVASSNTLTVPANASVGIAVGSVIQIRQVGTGKTTIVADTGVTINTPETLKLRKAGSTASLVKVAANTWDLTGDLEASA